ncbi:MAG: hypothetical protein LBH79_07575 [Nitrososphaerota archaeon]|jgi:hypothetical protein|nr:hypothetical protein [Nitrososphaerota archaeon]
MSEEYLFVNATTQFFTQLQKHITSCGLSQAETETLNALLGDTQTNYEHIISATEDQNMQVLNAIFCAGMHYQQKNQPQTQNPPALKGMLELTDLETQTETIQP